MAQLTQLPRFVLDLLAACPAAGGGVHNWLFRVARVLHAFYADKDELAALIGSAALGCGREIPASEIAAAMANSAACAWTPERKTTYAPTSGSRWPLRNQEQIEAVVAASARWAAPASRRLAGAPASFSFQPTQPAMTKMPWAEKAAIPDVPPAPAPAKAVPAKGGEKPKMPPPKVFAIGELETPPKDDPNELIKHRYLCRGSGMLVVGPTGVGKSTFTLQAALCWAVGREHFGLVPARPLRSLIIQSENDHGDLAEMRDGIYAGLNFTERERREANERVLVAREDCRTAAEFCDEVIAPLLDVHQIDILWIDPALAYIGGEANSQKDTGGFLRNHLNPLVHKHNCAVSPGRDSRFTIRHNPDQDNQWWVYYEPMGADPIPADHAHSELVERVNRLKEIEGNAPGGSFSITEHGQVIARMTATSGPQNAWHVVDVASGDVFAYTQTITFLNGALDPSATPAPGTPWTGPLCGSSYTFAAPNAPRPPSNNLEEVRIEVNGIPVQLSIHAGISPYPPAVGALATFLAALRQFLPSGGRFRVNEKGRAFTSNDNLYVGTVPAQPEWFRPISPMD